MSTFACAQSPSNARAARAARTAHPARTAHSAHSSLATISGSALIAALALILCGCNTTSTPNERARLHGPPLTEADVVEIQRAATSSDVLPVEARLRGVGFDIDDGARSRLLAGGVPAESIARLESIAREPDALGGQDIAANRPLVAAGIVLGAAAVTAVVWLMIELFDEADHKTIIVNDGHTVIVAHDR